MIMAEAFEKMDNIGLLKSLEISDYSSEELKKMLEGGESKPLTIKSKAGNTYRARLYLEKENNVIKVKAKYETKNKR